MGLPKNAVEKEQSSTQTQYFKNLAFLSYKAGDQKMGQFYLGRAIEYASQEKESFSISEINAIMDGKVFAPAPREESAEKNASSKGDLKRIESLCEEFKKIVEENIKEIHDRLSQFQELSPALEKAA